VDNRGRHCSRSIYIYWDSDHAGSVALTASVAHPAKT
jgi:hypothetical protein